MSSRTVNGAKVAAQPAAAEREDAGRWKLVAVSVTGKAHLLRDQGNEDALHCVCLADGTLLLALADGAGSARLAAEGSRLAVETAVASLSERLAQESASLDLDDALQGSLADVRSAIAARLRESRRNERLAARDLSSTLLLAVVRGESLAILQIGDGATVARTEGGWQRVTQPIRGHHAGETVFATSRGAARQAETLVRPLEGIRAFALLSDGLEPVATDLASGEPHAPFFDPLVSFVEREVERERLEADLAAFLISDRVQQRSSDDLSLILAVRRNG